MHPRPSQCSLPSKHRSQPSPWVCGNEISRGFQGSLPRALSADEPLLRLPLSRSCKIVSVFLFAFLIYRSVSGLSSFIPFLFFFPSLLFPFFSYFFPFYAGVHSIICAKTECRFARARTPGVEIKTVPEEDPLPTKWRSGNIPSSLTSRRLDSVTSVALVGERRAGC